MEWEIESGKVRVSGKVSVSWKVKVWERDR